MSFGGGNGRPGYGSTECPRELGSARQVQARRLEDEAETIRPGASILISVDQVEDMARPFDEAQVFDVSNPSEHLVIAQGGADPKLPYVTPSGPSAAPSSLKQSQFFIREGMIAFKYRLL
jgi:hypothetical protein